MRFLSYWPKQYFDYLIHNLKTTGPTKISIPFFNFLDNLLEDAYIISRKGVDDFEIEHKTC